MKKSSQPKTVKSKQSAVAATTGRPKNSRPSRLVKLRRQLSTRAHRAGVAIVRVSPAWLQRIERAVARYVGALVYRGQLFMRRRPHRSFRVTRRRDYKRSLQLQGYWAFTNSVRAILWRNKKLFGGLIAVYFIVALAIGGFGQQDAYKNLSEGLTTLGGDLFSGEWGQVGQASLLLTTSVMAGLTPDVTAAQSVLAGLAMFFAWLATIWALRNVMAGRSVAVRDAVYGSGSPVIATVVVGLVLALQLVPISIAILVYEAAISSQFISGGVEQMLAWAVVGLLGVLSLYWVTSTFIALVVVTLPGMYPFHAIQTAGDLVVGRRLRILLRLLWGSLLIVIVWLLIMIPLILGDAWLKSAVPAISWLPIVPVAIIIMSSITVVFATAYTYILYRKVVDDDAAPA